MSGSITAGDVRTGNFLDALAHPTVVNPMGAMGSAADVANKVWGIRKWQADQAAGEAAQGAIDPNTGEYDPNRARTLLNQAGPGAALAAQQSLLNTQSMSNDQLKQAQSKASWLNAASGAALQSGDFSDAGMLRMFQSGIATGMFTLPEIQRQMAILPPDAAGRQQWLREHQMTSASVQQQLDVTQRGGMSPEQYNATVMVPYPKFLPDGKTQDPRYGTSFPMKYGDAQKLFTTNPQGGGGGGGSGTGTTSGLPSSLRYNPQNPNSTAPQAPNKPPAAPGTAPAVIPTGDPRNPTNVPGPPGGAAGPVTPYAGPGMGGAISAAPAPAAASPPATATPPPPVAPAQTPPPVVTPPPRPVLPPNAPTAALQGGVQVAGPNYLAPQTAAPSAPGPAVPGYVAAIQAGMAQARGAPLAGGTATAAATPEAGWGTAPGTPGSYGTTAPRPAPAAAPPATSAPAAPQPYFGTTANPADIKTMELQAQRNVEGFNQISQEAVQSRNRSAILGNMLGDTTKFSTGPLTQVFATLRNVANRFGIPVDMEAVASQEQVVKLGAQLANAQGANSDSRMALNIQANPHQELSPQGIDLMLRSLQGNEDYLQARAKLALSSGATDIRQFEADYGAKLDPRAFQVARMTDQQAKEYDAGLSKTDREAVRKSYNWAVGQGLVGR